MQPEVVSAERWLELAAHQGVFNCSRFGSTPRDETAVRKRHVHDEHIAYFCMHNGFDVVFNDTTVRVSRGSFIWIMPGVLHATRLMPGRRPFQCFYLLFTLTDDDRRTPVRLSQDWACRDDAWHIFPIVRDLVQELQSPQSFHEQRLRANLLLLSASALSIKESHRNVLNSQLRLRLHRYIENHVNGKITPQALADEVGLSMRYFRRIFNRSFGMSPKHWIVRQRVILAATLLAGTKLTAKEIAYRLGYCDAYLFSRQFKQMTGISPRTYRNGIGGEPVWDHLKNDMKGAVYCGTIGPVVLNGHPVG